MDKKVSNICRKCGNTEIEMSKCYLVERILQQEGQYMAIYDVMKSGFSRYYKVEANTEQEAIELVKMHPEFFYEETDDEAEYDVLPDEYAYGETFDEKGLEELSQELKKALASEEYVSNCQAITREMDRRIKEREKIL